MSTIKRINSKTGVSFQITVTQGRDINGRQVRHYRTWKPEGRMTERQMQRAVERAAAGFEREIEQGFQTDNRQTFSEYARYVIALKRSAGIKERTLAHYEYLLTRCDRAIGHLRLCDIRPQHLNLFYQNLQEEDELLLPYNPAAKAAPPPSPATMRNTISNSPWNKQKDPPALLRQHRGIFCIFVKIKQANRPMPEKASPGLYRYK